jgi:hypothetical protein
MASLKAISEAMAEVMKGKGLSLEQIERKVPKGFWTAVKAICGDERADNVMSTFWKRNQAPMTEIIKRHLGTEATLNNVTIVDSVPSVNAQPPDANIDNVSPEPLDKAETDERIKELTSLVYQQGERIDSIDESLNLLIANVTNFMNEQPAKDTETRAIELVDEHKKETQSRLYAIEKTLNTLSDNVGNIIMAQAEGTPRPASGEHKELPKPPKHGKRFAGHYAHVRGVLDVVLLDMLTKKSEEFGNNVSKALTAILWEHFGTPKLSFEIPENELETLKLKYPAQDRSKG